MTSFPNLSRKYSPYVPLIVLPGQRVPDFRRCEVAQRTFITKVLWIRHIGASHVAQYLASILGPCKEQKHDVIREALLPEFLRHGVTCIHI